MKLYVLTHCAAEKDYAPMVFGTRAEAQERMKQIADELIYKRDADGEIIDQYSNDFEIYPNSVEIYYGDDSYDNLEIFEVQEPMKTIRRKQILDTLLDDRCDMYGIVNTIQYLFDLDFDQSEIEELGFDKADIQKAIEEDEEDEEEDS